MCAERTPILSNAIPAFEMFMSAWEQLGTRVPRLEQYTGIGLDWALKYYKKMDSTRAYVVAMSKWIWFFFFSFQNKLALVLNPTMRMTWIQKNWEKNYIDTATKMIKDLVRY